MCRDDQASGGGGKTMHSFPATFSRGSIVCAPSNNCKTHTLSPTDKRSFRVRMCVVMVGWWLGGENQFIQVCKYLFLWHRGWSFSREWGFWFGLAASTLPGRSRFFFVCGRVGGRDEDQPPPPQHLFHTPVPVDVHCLVLWWWSKNGRPRDSFRGNWDHRGRSWRKSIAISPGEGNIREMKNNETVLWGREGEVEEWMFCRQVLLLGTRKNRCPARCPFTLRTSEAEEQLQPRSESVMFWWMVRYFNRNLWHFTRVSSFCFVRLGVCLTGVMHWKWELIIFPREKVGGIWFGRGREFWG